MLNTHENLIAALADAVAQRIAASPPVVIPEGLAAADAAAFIGVSVSKFRAMDNAGHVPAPAMLGDGNCPRWSRSELVAWLRAGAPSRPRWILQRDTALRRVG